MFRPISSTFAAYISIHIYIYIYIYMCVCEISLKLRISRGLGMSCVFENVLVLCSGDLGLCALSRFSVSVPNNPEP